MAREISLTQRRGRSRFLAYWGHARDYWGRFPESGAVFGFVFVLAFFTIATTIKVGNPQILDGRSIASIATNATVHGIIAVGITMLMISGEFDLSVGSILGLSALMFIIAASNGPGGLLELIPILSRARIESWGISYSGMSGPAAIAVALATGALLGLFNGLLLVWSRIPSFIVTLGTLYIYRSIMLNIIPGGTIARYGRGPIIWSIEPLLVIALAVVAVAALLLFLWPTLRMRWARLRQSTGIGRIGAAFGLAVVAAVAAISIVLGLMVINAYAGKVGHPIKVDFFNILNGKLAFTTQNFRSSILWWIAIAALFTVILNHTGYGNAVFATGGNPEAARAQGVNVRRVKVMNFVISGTLAAVGGILEGARFQVVEPLRGTGYELDVIAAVVIGGTLLTGGYGSIFGAMLGILITFMLKTGTVLIGIEADWFRGVLGIIMIIAVVINTNIRRQR